MSTLRSRWDLDAIEVSKSAADAALRVVARLARQRADLEAQWA